MADIKEVLSRINPNDLRIDRSGRVVIDNPEIAKEIGELGKLPGIDEVAGNGICCGNTQCLSERLVSMLDRVVAGNR